MQLSILEQFTTEPIKKERVRVFEAFAGYGSQSLALDWLNIDYEPVGYAEIDPYAIKAHIALHGDVKNYGDVTKLSVADLPDMDLFTYSFPCQDISVAGKQNGLAKDSGTRSSLLWECERIIKGKRPKYLMMENVKNLVGVENYPHFMAFVQLLEGFGYNNYWQVINAKECGIPQNRERVFCVSVRQDVDDGSFYYEKPFDNGLRLKDLLESEVDEKYYIDEEKVQKLISQLKEGLSGHNPQNEYQISSALASREHRNSGWKDISPTLCARDYKDPKVVAIPCITPDEPNEIKQIGNLIETDSFGGNPQAGRIYGAEGIAPTLNTCGGGQREPKILEERNGYGPQILFKLFECNGTQKVQWEIRRFNCIQEEKVLQSEMYVRILDKNSNEEQKRKDAQSESKKNECKYNENKRMSDVWERWKNGCSSQEQRHLKLIERELDCIVQKLSFEGTQKESGMFDMWLSDEGVGLLRKALSKVQEIWKSSYVKPQNGFRIRKLTPVEVFRLMGLNDDQITKIQSADISNSQQYKMAGNSIVVQQMAFLKNLPGIKFKHD